jgi:hypothetical protein
MSNYYQLSMASIYLSNLIEKGTADIASLESTLQEARECLSPESLDSLPLPPLSSPLTIALTCTVLSAISTDRVLRMRLEDAMRIRHVDYPSDEITPLAELLIRAAAQSSVPGSPYSPLTLPSRSRNRIPAPADHSKKTNATITIHLYAHDQSIPDPSKPRGPSWAECTFELTDYDPTLPLHLFATVKLRDKGGKAARPLLDEHLTKTFTFAPTTHESGREWGLALRSRLRSGSRLVSSRTASSRERVCSSERDGKEPEGREGEIQTEDFD